MFKHKSKTTLKWSMASVMSGWFKVVLFVVALTGVFLYTRAGAPARVEAATSDTLNFQARLLKADGSIVPDGTYNVEFKLYNSATVNGTPDQGACSHDGGTAEPTCLWVETRTGGNKVTVRAGYLSVHLGDVNSFPAINWDQNLYLTMNIGGQSGPTWDGEMTPRLKLTAVPYAFRAGGLTLNNGANNGNLSFGTVSNNPDVKIPDIAGTNNLLLQSGTTLFTQGSIPFVDATGRLTQDNGNFFFDDTNNRLGIGNANPGTVLDISGALTIRGLGSAPSVSNSNEGILYYDNTSDKLKVSLNGVGYDEVCTVTAGNCAGSGTGITGSGTQYRIAYFDTSGAHIGSSFILQDNTGGSESLTINDDVDFVVDATDSTFIVDAHNDKVGIGTLTPNTTLDVNGTITVRGQATAPAVSNNNEGTLYYDSTSDTFKVSTSTGSYADICTQGSGCTGGTGIAGSGNQYRIAYFDTSGSHIGSSAILQDNTLSSESLTVNDDYDFIVDATDGTFIVDAHNNYVGIGTSTPGFTLDVADNINTGTAFLLGGFSAITNSTTELEFGNDSNWQSVGLFTNGSERLSIDSTGRVGIGNTTPTAQLTVAAPNQSAVGTNATAALTVTGGQGGSAGAGQTAGNGSTIGLTSGQGGNATAATATPGNGGALSLTSGAGGNGNSTSANGNGGTISIQGGAPGTGGSGAAGVYGDVILQSTGGNVGIGTSSNPTALLSVGGANGNFTVNAAGAITATTGIATTGGYIQSGTTANTFTGATTFSASGTALTVSNNATISGTATISTLSVTGNSTLVGGVTLGNGSSATGTLLFKNSTNNNTVTLSSGTTSTGYTLYLPTAIGVTGDCLLLTAGGQLSFGDCANGQGTAFLQGGNDFGSTTVGVLGTKNNGNLDVITNNLTRFTVEADGDIAFDTDTLFVDAANDRIGIGTITPATELDVVGDGQFSGSITVGANLTVTGTSGLVGAVTLGNDDAVTPIAGQLIFHDTDAANGYALTLESATSLADNITVTLPNPTSGTTAVVCYQGDTACGFLSSGSSGSFVSFTPSSAQTDNSANDSIFINDTGGGNLLRLQSGAADKFVVNNAGNVSVAGTLAVTGTSTFTGLITANGGITLGASQALTINSDAVTDLTGSGIVLSSGALTVDASTSTGFFRNGGNSFGVTGVLGTNDNNDLQIRTNGTTRVTVSATGDITQAGSGAFTTGTGAVTLNGATTVAGTNTFTVNGGLTTLSAGLTATGTINLNASGAGTTNVGTGTGNTTVGNATGTLTLQGASVVLGTATVTRTAAGTTTFDFVDGSNTTLAITNSGVGNANLTVDGTITAAQGLTVSAGGANITGTLAVTGSQTFASGANRSISVGQETGTNTGNQLTITAGQGGSGGADGGALNLTGGAAGGSGNNNGGNVAINGGAKTGTGTVGNVVLQGTVTINAAGAISGATGLSSSGTIAFGGLSTNGLVKTTGGTGTLAVATAGTDYEVPLTFTNGLTRSTNTVSLGGNLTGATTLGMNGNALTFDGSTGDIVIAASGAATFGNGIAVTGTTDINTTGSAATNIGTGSYSGTVSIGNTSSTTTVLGTVNINNSGAATTNIAASGTGNTNIGNSTGTLTLQGASILLNTATISRTAAGTTTFDLVDAGNTTLALTNSGTGVANLTADGNITATGNLQGTIVNATTGFRVNGAATAGNYLRGDGTNFIGSALLASDLSGTIFSLSGDANAGTNTVVQGTTVNINGGTNGIDTSLNNNTYTINLDTTEIATATFGSGSGFTWTFDASGGTDTSVTFGNNTLSVTSGTTSFSGNLVVTGGTATLGASGTAGGLYIYDGGSGGAANTIQLVTDTNANLTTDTVVTVPKPFSGSTATLCYQNDPSCGFALTSGSGSYVQFDPGTAQDDTTNNNSIFINKTLGSGGSLVKLQYNASDVFNVANNGDVTLAGNLAVNGGSITTTATTAAIFNTNVTDLSIGGAATTLTIGATSGTTTIRNNVDVDGNLTVGTSNAFTINSSGAITAATGITSSGTITFSGLTANRLVATNGSSQLVSTISSANLAASITDETGTGVAVFGTSPTFTTSVLTGSTSFDVFNTTATTINAFGAATTLNIGASTGTLTLNNPTINLAGTNPTVSASASNSSLTVTSNGTGTLNLGTNATAHSTNVGSSTSTATTTINAGTGGLNLGDNGVANTIQIGNTTGAVAQTINLGNNNTASSTTSVVIGSTIGSSTTTIQAGSGGLVLNTSTIKRTASGTTTFDLNDASNTALALTNSGAGVANFTADGNITATGNLQGTIVNATTGFQVNGAATTGNYLRGDGTNFVSSALVASDLSGTIFNTSADSGTSTLVTGDTLAIQGGTNGIDTSLSGDTYTLNLDTTEIGTTTFANNADFTWTFNSSGATDPAVAFGNNSINLTAGTITATGNLTTTGNLQVDGSTTLGDASGDTLTLNGTAVTIPNNLNFDSNTLFIDAANNRIGVGTNSPSYTLDVRTPGSTTSQVHISSTNTDAGGYLISGGDANFFMSGGAAWNGTNWVAKATTSAVAGTSNGNFSIATDSGLTAGNTFTPSTRIMVLSTGNVGIGDTSPASLLTVGASDAFQVDSTGRVFANVGASGAGNLGFSFVGDTDTGFYRSAANAITFQTNGADRLTVDASGNVNINSLTASRALFTDASKNLVSTGASAALLNALSDETGTGVAVFGTSPTITTSILTGSTSFDVFNTTATTINAFGAATTLNLGASTGTTTVGNDLAVNGNLTVGNASGDSVSVNASTFTFANDTNFVLSGGVNGLSFDTNTLSIDATNHRIGIGTTTPNYQLEVRNDQNALTAATVINASSGTGAFSSVGGGNGTATGDAAVIGALGTSYTTNGILVQDSGFIQSGANLAGGLSIYTNANAPIRFGTNIGGSASNERLRIDSNGNVGIGDTSPASLLTVGASDAFQVDSSGRVFANVGASGAGNLGFSFVGDTNTGFYRSAADAITFQTNGADRLTLDASGNVNINSLSAGGLVKAAATTGQLSVATAGTDYEVPLTFNNGLTRTSNTVTLGGNLNAATTLGGGSANSLNITSDLSTGARSAPVFSVSQANDATNNLTGALVEFSNSDTGSTATVLRIQQVNNGSALVIQGANTGTGIDLTTSTTSGTQINLKGSDLTTGNSININGANSGALSAFTGDIINVHPTRTLTGSGSINDTGNFLDLTRNNTNNGSGTYTVSGALANLQSTCGGSGTCTDTANILNLSQQYANASGAVLNVSGAGTGNLAILDATNASANGVSIDVQSSSSSQYAFSVTSNNGAIQGLYVRADGNVGIGNSSPAALFSVGSSSQFQVSGTGAVTAVGVNSGSGQIQGTGGISVSGNATLGATAGNSVSLGNTTGTVTITGSSSSAFALNGVNVSAAEFNVLDGGIDLTSEVTGVLPVANGGSGANSLTGILLGNGTSPFTAATTSAGIAGAISDETGTGALVFGASPSFTTSVTTGSTSFSVFNTTATTINAFGAATTLTLGATTGTTNIRNDLDLTTGNISSSGTNVDLTLVANGTGTINLNDTVNVSTLTASRALFTDASKNLVSTGTSSMLLNTLSDETGTGVAVFGTSPSITTSITTGSTSFDVFNTTATTINAFGAATTLTLGATTGTTTIRNDLNLTTGNISSSGTNADLTLVANGTGTINLNDTVNVSTLTASRLVATDGSKNLVSTISSANLAASISDETGTGLSVFATSPQFTTSVTTGSASFDVFNTGATTLNAFGAATTLQIGATTGTLTLRNPTINLSGTNPSISATATNSNLTLQANGTGTLFLDSAGGGNVEIGNNASTIYLKAATEIQSGLNVTNPGTSETQLSVDTSARSGGAGNLVKIGNSTGTNAATTVLQLDSASADITSDLSFLNGGLYYYNGNGTGANARIKAVINNAVDEICTYSAANCSGVGGGVTATGSSNTNYIPVFTGNQTLAAGWLFQNTGTNTVEVINSKNLSLVGGNLSVTGNGTFSGDLAVNGGDITSTGALTITPNAGSNLNVTLSGTGDFAINTNQLYVDTSTGNVGIGTSTPGALFTVGSGDLFQVNSSGNVIFNTGADHTISVAQATSGNNGNILTINAGNGNGSNKNGGNLVLRGGASTGTGTAGNVVVDPQTNSTYAFNVVTSGNPTASVFNVDTIQSRAGVNLGASGFSALWGGTQNGLEVNGALVLSGGSGNFVTNFNTPVGSSVPTKINIPTYDAGAYGQVLAFGLPSTGCTNIVTDNLSCTARAISVFDARSVAHQPTIAIFSPDENSSLGFSWDGSNTEGLIKSTGTDIGIQAGATSLATFSAGSGGAITLKANTQVNGILAVSTLGTANTATYVCRNSANQLATCNTTGTGAAFVQGGNAFGATAVLGTTDANDLNIVTGGSSNTRIGITANGATTITGGTTSNPDALTVTNSTSTGNILVLKDNATTVLTVADGGSINSTATVTANGSVGLQGNYTITNSTASASQYGQKLNITSTGTTASTIYGQYIGFTDATSTANTTYGLYVDATTANASDTNYAASFMGGNVGIGTITPSNLLTVTTQSTISSRIAQFSGTTTNDEFFRIGGTQNPAATSSTFVLGTTIDPTVASTTARGMYVQPVLTGSTNVSNFTAGAFGVNYAASGARTGTLTNAKGLVVTSPSFNTGTAPTNTYGLHVNNQGATGVTNTYGLYVDVQSGSTNNYAAIFEGGGVGIGDTTPTEALFVLGGTHTLAAQFINTTVDSGAGVDGYGIQLQPTIDVANGRSASAQYVAGTFQTDAGETTDAYGIQIGAPTKTGSGTITNYYGLYLANPGSIATNNNALYVAGGRSIFNGNVAIGATTVGSNQLLVDTDPGDNRVGIRLQQEDTTNNNAAFQIANSGTGNAIEIDTNEFVVDSTGQLIFGGASGTDITTTTNKTLTLTANGTGKIYLNDEVTIGTVAGADTDSYVLCRDNSTGQITYCDTNQSGHPFIQGGNTFGATAVLGTADSNSLQIVTGGSSNVRLAFDTSGNAAFTPLNSGTVSVTSALSSGARSAAALVVSQANDGTNNNSTNLVQFTNSDTGSTADVLQVTNACTTSCGAGINVVANGSSAANGSGYSLTGSAGTITGFNANAVTSGTAFSATGLTTGGTGINLSLAGTSTGITIAPNGNGFHGKFLNMVSSQSDISFGLNNNLVDLTLNRTLTNTSGSSFSDSANYLNINRNDTVNNTNGYQYNITGDLVNLQSSCTQTSGTCNDATSILKLSQNFSGATGAVLNLTNAGSGAAILLNSGASIASAATVNLSLTSGTTGNVSVDSGTTGQVNIGTGTSGAGKAVTIGNTNGTTGVTINTGSNNLAINGNTTITGKTSGDALIVSNSTSTGNIFVANDNATTVFQIANGGNVTIGTGNADEVLNVNGDSRLAELFINTGNAIQFNGDDGDTYYGSDSAFEIWHDTGNDILRFGAAVAGTAGAGIPYVDVLAISSNAFVGIGDISPAALFTVGNGDKFQIDGNGDVTTVAGENLSITTGTTGNLTVDSGTTGQLNIGTGTSGAGKAITIGNTNGTTGVTINTGSTGAAINGNTVITGATTGVALTVSNSTSTGNIFVANDNATAAFTIADGGSIQASNTVSSGTGYTFATTNTGASGFLVQEASNSSSQYAFKVETATATSTISGLVVRADGRVGIGTSNPSARFDVQQNSTTAPGVVVNLSNGGSQDIIDLNISGTTVAKFNSSGNLVFNQSASVSTTTNGTFNLDIATGNHNAGASGTLGLQTGTGTSGSGGVNIATGTTTTGASGNVSITTGTVGAQTGAGVASGTVSITTGNGSATSGASSTGGASGNLTINTGTGGANTSGSGTNAGGAGGTLTVQAGAGGTIASVSGTPGAGGAVLVKGGTGGAGTSTSVNGNGGTVTLQGGTGGTGGSTTTGTQGGNLVLQGGAKGGTLSEGSVIVKPQANNALVFQIQNAAGTAFLTADSANGTPRILIGAPTSTLSSAALVVTTQEITTTLRIGDGTNAVVFNDTTCTGCSTFAGKLRFIGSARNSINITLSPEFQGATLSPTSTSNIGTMTSDFCSDALNINDNATAPNTVVCANGSSDIHNYYSWTTTQGSAQSYSIFTRWHVPSNFSAFDTTAAQFYSWRSTSSDGVTVTFYKAGTSCGTASLSSNAAWTLTNISSMSGCTINANDDLTIKIDLTATSGNYGRMGEILINYLANF